MLIFAMKAELYLPQIHSLKEKRQIRRSLVDRLMVKNISVIEAGRQDEHHHLLLLLCYGALGEQEAKKKKDFILELFYEVSEHINVEDELISVE